MDESGELDTSWPTECYEGSDLRFHTIENSMWPKTPVIMLVSRQLRREYRPYNKDSVILKCNSYDEFRRWYHAIGESGSRIAELHLQMDVHVKVWTRLKSSKGAKAWRSRPQAAVLRVRFNDFENEDTLDGDPRSIRPLTIAPG